MAEGAKAAGGGGGIVESKTLKAAEPERQTLNGNVTPKAERQTVVVTAILVAASL